MPSREVTSLTTADVLTRVEVKLFFKRSLNGKVITTTISCASRPDAVRMAREINLWCKVDVAAHPKEGLGFKCHSNGTMTWDNPSI